MMRKSLLWLGLVALWLPSYGQAPLAELHNKPDNPYQHSGTSLVHMLQTLEEEYQMQFSYDQELLQNKTVATEAFSKQEDLEAVLTRLLKPLRLTYEQFDDKTYVIYPEAVQKPLPKVKKQSLESVGQPSALPRTTTPTTEPTQRAVEKTITGKVTDLSTGEELPGVNILVKGTSIGTITDVEGNYRLNAPDDAETLVFSSVGYTSEEVAIGDQTVINLEMAPDIQSLSEVVVIGYGEQERKDVTSAIASVDGEQIENQPSPSVEGLLQGRAAGVQVVQNTGAPGAGMSVRVRGSSTLGAGNEPLYVIDGVPIKSGEFTSLGGGETPGISAMADINPNDIQSIEILKDAAATSIYGARAANGVVLITTKRGVSGKMRLNFNTYHGFQETTKYLSTVNSREDRNLRIESLENANNDIVNFVADSLNPSFNNDINWQREIFRTAPVHNYDLSLRGGDTKLKYALSLGYFDQDGILLNTFFKRYSTRVNVDYQANDKLEIGSSLAFSQSSSNRLNNNNNNLGVVYTVFNEFPPSYSPYNVDGSLKPGTNPVNVALRAKREAATNRLIGNYYLRYEILEGLKFSSTFGIDLLALKEDSFLPSTVRLSNREASTRYFSDFGWINENTLSYSKTINENHQLTGLIGVSFQENHIETINAVASQAATDNIPSLNAGVIKEEASTTESNYGIVSAYARLNYIFRDKYLLGATVRRDGSSRFGENNRYGIFPSASLGWRISEESFMQNLSAIDDLKLRASAGRTGNQSIGNYIAQGLYESGQNYAGLAGISPTVTGLSNRDLSWESTLQYNLGLDITMLDQRVNILADYYHKRTEDLLFTINLPRSSGYEGVITNLGSILNRGAELNITTRNFREAFTWTTNFNISYNQNEVLELPDGEDIIQIGNGIGGILREGEPIGSFYVLEFEGVYATDEDNVDELRPYNANTDPLGGGDAIFKDQDGNGIIDDQDRIIAGNAYPDFTGGINNSFSYKGLSLEVLLNFSLGNDVYNYTKARRDSYEGARATGSRDALNRWNSPGDITDVPKLSRRDRSGNYRASTKWIEDGSFLRIRNVSLSYQLPSSLVERLRLSNVRVYTIAQNLWTFTNYSGYDPEVVTGQNSDNPALFGVDNFPYPLSRTFTLGAEISF